MNYFSISFQLNFYCVQSARVMQTCIVQNRITNNECVFGVVAQVTKGGDSGACGGVQGQDIGDGRQGCRQGPVRTNLVSIIITLNNIIPKKNILSRL